MPLTNKTPGRSRHRIRIGGGLNRIEFYTVCTVGHTFDPSITLKAGCPYTPVWTFGDGTSATGTSVSKNDYADAGPHLVTLTIPDMQVWLTGIDVNTDNISGNFLQSLVACRALTNITAYSNGAMNGAAPNIAAWPSLATFSIPSTGVTGVVTAWVLPASLKNVNIYSTGVTGVVTAWVLPASLTYFSIASTGVTGVVTAWVLPASLAYFYIYSTGVTGVVTAWVLPANLENLYIYSTGVTGAPIMTSAVALANYRQQDCALLQANVDAILAAVYARRASFTAAAPALNVGGTNQAPSGVYADEDPPVTGKGMAFELVNDPETEGFKKWAITFTA